MRGSRAQRVGRVAVRERRAMSAAGTPVADGPASDERRPPASTSLDWLTTTDHKRIGILYITSAFGCSSLAA